MVPKIHAKGTSFVGIGQYILHDKDHASTSDRVEWHSTRNLVTDDPFLATKLMAATALDADRLKSTAGVKNTGRKSNKSVLHMTLAWHPKEGEALTQEEMQRAADQAIKSLGAEDRQALIVGHNDEDQPHIHIVINRVSDQDGKMLSSSKEKLNLSKWAQQYEEQRGELLCEQRKINNDARDRGEYVRGEKDVPRHIYEQHGANDNRSDREDHHREQHEKDRAVGKEQRAIKDKQAKAWAKLAQDHKDNRTMVAEQRKSDTLTAQSKIQSEYRNNQWKELFHEHQAEMQAFERDEGTFLGRMKNRVKSIDFKGMVGSDGRGCAISEAFDAISSSGARKEWLKDNQTKQENALKADQKSKEDRAAQDAKELAQGRLVEARAGFESERAALVFKCAGESTKMRAQWKTRTEERTAEPAMKPKHDDGPQGIQTTQLDDRLQGLVDDHNQRFEEHQSNLDNNRDLENDQDPGDDEIDL